MKELVIALVSAVIGAFVGWFLNELSTSRKERPRLCFEMTSTPKDMLTEPEFRTKTSISEHGIEIFNLGMNAFILQSFTLYYKRKILVDCVMDDDNRIIEPSKYVTYTLMEQEIEALQYQCNQHHFKECKVIAYSVDGKKVKGKLEVPLFYLRANFIDHCGIV